MHEIKGFNILVKCNGQAKCRNSSTCSFNTGIMSDCGLTSNPSLAKNRETAELVTNFFQILDSMKGRFEISYDPSSKFVTFTEVENGD